jgi:hypothetical protein
MRNRFGGAFLVALMAAVCAGPALGLGEEEFGNKPLNEANFKDWPGIMPVVNHSSRIYRTWVNGNEHFYYKSDVAGLNDALEKFSAAADSNKEVVVRPGPGVTNTFDQKTKVEFTWSLHLIGGIAKHLTTRDKGDVVWRTNPVLTIYVYRDLDLNAIRIPKGVSVLTLPAVKKRIREALGSEDKTVRGWSLGEMAQLDPYDEQMRDAVASMLRDPDDWVRLNAVHALGRFGAKAKSALPLARSTLASADPRVKEDFKKAIEVIEKAEDRSLEEKEHRCIEMLIEKRFPARI